LRLAALEVGKTVEKAVSLAEKQINVSFEPNFRIAPWTLLGFILREKIGMEEAWKAAQIITKQVNVAGLRLQPAVTSCYSTAPIVTTQQGVGA
jgi:hypothetical protein